MIGRLTGGAEGVNDGGTTAEAEEPAGKVGGCTAETQTQTQEPAGPKGGREPETKATEEGSGAGIEPDRSGSSAETAEPKRCKSGWEAEPVKSEAELESGTVGRRALSGVVLAGGKNRRMGGRSKALLTYGGQSFLARQLAVLGQLCSERMLITEDPLLYKSELECAEHSTPVRVLPDVEAGRGPLGGLEAAMLGAESNELWVVGCDMPHISAGAADVMLSLRLGEDWDAVLPRVAGRLHPLHGIYHRRCLIEIQQLLEKNEFRVMRLLERIRWRAAEEEDFTARGLSLDFVKNVNNPDDYAELIGQRT